MSIKESREEIEYLCLATGIKLATYSPGDGITRYRFYKPVLIDGIPTRTAEDYFGIPDSRKIYTALGLKEAHVWSRGFRSGFFTGYDHCCDRNGSESVRKV
jgi:hypothetical protein